MLSVACDVTMHATLEELYGLLNEKAENSGTRGGRAPEKDYCFRLRSLDELHFLDWHAVRLLSRACQKVALALDEPTPLHVRVRTVAEVSTISERSGEQYEPGAVLARFLDLPERVRVWRDYLTSRDSAPPERPLAGATLNAQFPHLRVGFLSGIDLFHMGEYYAAHEDWESLWMRLDEGAERLAAQSLIQLAGAHIHRLKNRSREARKLYANARRTFQRVDDRLGWLNVSALIETSDFIFDMCDATQEITWPMIPLRNQHSQVARKHR